ncbi:hypothetical protein [Gimesia fumaroli]|uniref:Uncharacterized protein n=1 Tax=Gimesia fumaroli TaxID=2527976 RepID=A0A518ILL7_9PLAN|nr:hypothetical protein [Gimesia fumaroli]QDV53935.1 hypothetical protein Enr17x_60180 [Gimesia fumaroli]
MTTSEATYLLIPGVIQVLIVAVFYGVFFYFVKRQLDKRLFLLATLSTLNGIVFMIIFFRGAFAILFAVTMFLIYLPYLYYYWKGLPAQSDNA